MSNRTRQNNNGVDRNTESNDSPEIPDRGEHQKSPASLWAQKIWTRLDKNTARKRQLLVLPFRHCCDFERRSRSTNGKSGVSERSEPAQIIREKNPMWMKCTVREKVHHYTLQRLSDKNGNNLNIYSSSCEQNTTKAYDSSLSENKTHTI